MSEKLLPVQGEPVVRTGKLTLEIIALGEGGVPAHYACITCNRCFADDE